MIIDEFIFTGGSNASLKVYIDDYIHAQAVLQTISNPSGTFYPAGLGLGEPKYEVNGTRFNGAWGRPQRDGPGLRAIALMTYSNFLIKNGGTTEATTNIWPIIANDLSYVGQYWNQTGFDLWEEIQGSSFFTIQNQHRALAEGAQLATTLGVTCTGCDQAPQLLCFLQNFWNGEHIVSNINVDINRTGLDGNSILGPIAIFDLEALCNSSTLQPCHSQSLANFKVLTDTFRALYTVNANIPKGSGVAVGRYAEDVYKGGNPWYLITSAAAEFLYDAVAQWNSSQSISVDATSQAFFKDVYPDVTVKTYTGGDITVITDAVTAYADSYAAIVEKYTPSNGSLAEQFDRDAGVALSAIDLTWSYAGFVTMSQRRAGQFPASWGSRNAAPPSSSCTGGSTAGLYVPATAAGAPNVTETCQVNVVFNVNATTYYGEDVYVVGNTTDIGAWNMANSIPMNAGKYSTADPLWYANVYLDAGETVSYTYVRQQDCGQGYLYETMNRTISVPACGGAAVTTEDAWTGPGGTSGNC